MKAEPNQSYRLPSQSEWLAAALPPASSNGSLFVWGDTWEPPSNLGNLPGREEERQPRGQQKGFQKIEDGFPFTAPAGSFPPNELGFSDLVGNVSEWLGDKGDRLPRGQRWIIGGAWDSLEKKDFLINPPPMKPMGFSSENIGFRCLLDASAANP